MTQLQSHQLPMASAGIGSADPITVVTITPATGLGLGRADPITATTIIPAAGVKWVVLTQL